MLFCLTSLLRRLLRKPLLLVGACVVLSGIGFYAYQNIALQHYFSWPYSTMKSNLILSLNIDKESLAEIKLPESGISSEILEYQVLAKSKDAAISCTAYGLEEMTKESLDASLFNEEVTLVHDISESNVLLDQDTASKLGIKAFDEITIIQRDADKEFKLRVTDIVPAYADTIGIVASNKIFKDMNPNELKVYFKDAEMSEIDSLIDRMGDKASEFEPGIQPKKEAQLNAKLNARKFLPYMRNDVLQITCCLIYAIFFSIIFVLVNNDQFKYFFSPAIKIGLASRKIMFLTAIELLILGIFGSVVASSVSLAMLGYLYHMPLSPMMWASATALADIGMLLAFALAIFICSKKTKRLSGN